MMVALLLTHIRASPHSMPPSTSRAASPMERLAFLPGVYVTTLPSAAAAAAALSHMLFPRLTPLTLNHMLSTRPDWQERRSHL